MNRPASRLLVPVAVLALACVLAAVPGRGQDTFTMEARFAADYKPTKETAANPVDPKQIEEVLKKRLPILTAGEGTVEIRSLEDIRVRVAADKLDDLQLRAFGRPGRVEMRHLEDVKVGVDGRGRYEIDILTIAAGRQQETKIRFKDRRTGRITPAAEFVAKCPLLVSGEDLVGDGARVVGSGAQMAVRVQVKEKPWRRVERLQGRDGALVAVTLDGELVSMNSIPPRSEFRRIKTKGGKAPAEPPKRKERQPKEEDLKEEGGTFDLIGGFSDRDDAGYLAVVLNAGPLPFPLKTLSKEFVAE